MTLDYQKVWNALNELELVVSKVCSARQILESALDALEQHKTDKAESLIYAADEFLGYYIDDFDKKFKDAWNETVVKLNREKYSWKTWEEFYRPEEYSNSQYTDEELNAMCDYAEQQESPFKDYWSNLNYDEYLYAAEEVPLDFSGEDYIQFDLQKEDKVVKWRLPVQETKNEETGETEYFIQFPDDLLERSGWKENDTLNWVDNGDGTYTLTKHTELLRMDEC